MSENQQEQENSVKKIEGTPENWENGLLGQDERYATLSTLTKEDLGVGK